MLAKRSGMKYVTLSDSVLRRMKSSVPSKVFTNKDFRDLGSRDGIDQALSRLVKEQAVRRIGRGLYDLPRIHPILAAALSTGIHINPFHHAF